MLEKVHVLIANQRKSFKTYVQYQSFNQLDAVQHQPDVEASSTTLARRSTLLAERSIILVSDVVTLVHSMNYNSYGWLYLSA